MSRYHRASAALPARTRWYHGTSAPPFERFRPGEAYLTDDPAEAMGFAEGGHLGGSAGGEPRVLEVSLAPGAVADADAEVGLIVMDEHPELDDIDDLMARLRDEGHRYADFTHPGFAGGDIRVRVSLHPEEDLTIVPDRRASAPAPARTGKGLDVLVEAEEGLAGGTVTVTDPATGRQVGSLDFAHVSDEWHRVTEVEVDRAYRRRGVATLMYDWVEKTMGKALLPSDDQTDDAVGFWTDRIGPYDPLDEGHGFDEETTASLARAAAPAGMERAIGSRGVRGDALLDALDLADDLVAAGADVSPDGIVTLYHRTDRASAEEIARTGRMLSREDRLFFGTDPDGGQISGHGDAAVRVRMPLERLELQAVMPGEAFVTVMSRGRPVRVDAEVVTASRRAWSRDTLDAGSMCADCGSDLDVAGRIEDGDDLVCRDCHRRRQAPEPALPPERKKRWWWNASVRTASWWSREMLDHKLARLDLTGRDATRFRALCERFLAAHDMDYLSDMCFWAASFLGAACDELGIPLRVSLGQYSPDGDGFDHGWLADSSGTPFDITAVAHAAHRRETRSGDMTGAATVCPACGEVETDCGCDDPPDPVERTRRFSDEDEMMDAGYECVERDQYPEWVSDFVGPDRYSGESGDAASARASELAGFDAEEEASARAMAREVLSAEGGAARRAARSIESEIAAAAAEVRRRAGIDHELEDGEPPKALCLEYARELADELVRRGFSAGVTQGMFEVDWPDESAYEDWDPGDFKGEGGDDEDAMSAEDVMGQAMHFPLHYWVRVTARGGEPIGSIYADITADQFDDECDESFDPVWVWTGDTDRHQAQRHDFVGAAFPQASGYHRARLMIADDVECVYHGTSLTQLEAIRDAGWLARDFYLADYREKSDDYADQQAARDGTCPVVLEFDMAVLRRMGHVDIDRGSGPEEWEQDMGQFVYSGPLRGAITNLGEVIQELRDEWGEEFLP